MHQPARPDTLRRLCGLVLLAWLLALLNGTVHACLLADPNTPASPWHALHEEAAGHLHDDHAAHDADQGAHHDVHSQHTGHADEHAACHKFCQDERITLTSAKHDGLDFTPALVPWGGPLPPAAPAPRSAAPARERPLAQGPPLLIRFLRLAL